MVFYRNKCSSGRKYYLIFLVFVALFVLAILNVSELRQLYYSLPNPTFSAEDYVARGSAKRALGFQLPYSEWDYTRAIRLEPTYAMAYYRRGQARQTFLKTESALEDFAKAIELEPENPDFRAAKERLLGLRAYLALSFEDKKAAAAPFESWKEELNTAMKEANFERVMELIKDSVPSKIQHDEHAARDRSSVQFKEYFPEPSGDLTLSEVNWVLKIDSKNNYARSLRASLHYRDGNYEQALRDYLASIVNQQARSNKRTLGTLYYLNGRHEEAISAYQEVLKSSTLDSRREALYNIAFIHNEGDQRLNACELLSTHELGESTDDLKVLHQTICSS